MWFSVGALEAQHDEVTHLMKDARRRIQSHFLPAAMTRLFFFRGHAFLQRESCREITNQHLLNITKNSRITSGSIVYISLCPDTRRV